MYDVYDGFAKPRARYEPRKRVNFKNLARDEFNIFINANGISTLAQSRFNQSRLFKIISAFRDFKKYHRVIFHSFFPALLFFPLYFSLSLSLSLFSRDILFASFRTNTCLAWGNEGWLVFYSQIVEKYFVRANKYPLPPISSDIVKYYSKICDVLGLVRSHLRDDKIVLARALQREKRTNIQKCIKSTPRHALRVENTGSVSQK